MSIYSQRFKILGYNYKKIELINYRMTETINMYKSVSLINNTNSIFNQICENLPELVEKFVSVEIDTIELINKITKYKKILLTDAKINHLRKLIEPILEEKKKLIKRYVKKEEVIIDEEPIIEEEKYEKKIKKKEIENVIEEKVIKRNTTYEDMEKYIKMLEKVSDSPDKDWWENEETEHIIIHDLIKNVNIELGIWKSGNGSKYLYNKQLNLVGEVQNWIDRENKVPKEFKNNDGVVMNLDIVLPYDCYLIYEHGRMFHELTPKIYYAYEYNEDVGIINTSEITY